ncbi:helix-turn-helix domain-containing protein [Bacteroides graminisolvens]|uniref:helix-turn-helix domain-containing protein n=1 Tax=Bacteroides graminisolvens TaxID=477666 RepID=UPI00240A943C|nr:helix-turn-helix domain-containing protein [Bacteroides graminisolvens]
MEVVIVDKMAFEELLSYASSLSEQIDGFCRVFEDKGSEIWLDAQDVCLILNISSRTLRTMRDNGQIGSSQINRKIYYKSKDVQKLLKQK